MTKGTKNNTKKNVVDSIKKIAKKSAVTLAAASAATSAYAGDITINSNTIVLNATNATNLADAATESLIVANGKTMLINDVSVGQHADANNTIVIGASDASANGGININQTAVLTYAPAVTKLTADITATTAINDNAVNARGDSTTFNGNVGGSSAAHTINIINLGTANTSGIAVFNGTAHFGALTIASGNHANEVSEATFAKTVVGAITLNDNAAISDAKVIFSGTTASIAATYTGAADGEGIVQITGTGKTFTGSFTTVGTLDVDQSAIIQGGSTDFKLGDIATGKVLTMDDAFVIDALTLTGTGKLLTVADGVAATTAVTSVINGAVDGNGIVENTNTSLTTFTGGIGATTGIGTLTVTKSMAVVGEVDAQNITVAEGQTLTVDDDFAGDDTILTTTAIIDFITDGVAAATTVTGTINGALVNGGVIKVTNTNVTTFASDIGQRLAIKTLDLDRSSVFNGDVSALGADQVNSMSATYKGDLTIAASKYVLNGTAAEVILDAAGNQTITGLVEGAGAEQGVIDNANTDGIVTFASAVGAVQLKEIELDADSKSVFKGITSTALLDVAGDATFEVKNNVLDDFDFAATSKLYIDDASIVAGDTVFILSADGDATSLVDGMDIYMPVNLQKGTLIKLFTTVTSNSVATTIAGDANTSLNDTSVIDYVATGVTDDVHITANAKTAATIASEQTITLNEAKSLSEAFTAAVTAGDADAQSAFETLFNSGSAATDNALMAKQLAPQSDTVSGTSVATNAMTGAVQGIVSNRMASLRSGDAYVTGMSAGDGMSANSGFIQAFSSQVEQSNRNVGTGSSTVFGFDAETSGVAIGFDGITDSGSTLGLSGSFSSTDIDGLGLGKSTNKVDSYTVSLYADKATENGYIEGSLTYGINDNTGSRKVTTSGLNRTYSSAYDSTQLSLKLSAGTPNEVSDGTFLTPFGSVKGTLINTDKYTETSSAAADNLRLTVAQDDVTSIVGSIGLKAHKVTDKGTPMISLAVNNEFGDNTINSTNSYSGGGTAFKTTSDVEQTSATLGLGYSFGNDLTSLEIGYEAEANNDEYMSHYGSVKIVSKF